MSENRFADCETVGDVLAEIRESVGKGWIIDRDIDKDAVARIAELTRPTVDKTARERALGELADAVSGLGAEAPTQWLRDKLDRIIDALNYTPEPTGHTSPQREWLPGDSDDVSPAPAVDLDALTMRVAFWWKARR